MLDFNIGELIAIRRAIVNERKRLDLSKPSQEANAFQYTDILNKIETYLKTQMKPVSTDTIPV